MLSRLEEVADAAEAAKVAAIDPTILSLASSFGAVVLTVIAGFIGAWIQSRREHRVWLRERRYLLFVEVMEWVYMLAAIPEERRKQLVVLRELDFEAAHKALSEQGDFNSEVEALTELVMDIQAQEKKYRAQYTILAPGGMPFLPGEVYDAYLSSGPREKGDRLRDEAAIAIRKALRVGKA